MRLLEETPGTVVRRDVIIHDVWDRYGYTGTGNSLNQYISLLRRNFAALGLVDIIETIPKQGFALRHDLVVRINLESAPEHIDKKDTSVPLTVITSPMKNNWVKRMYYSPVFIMTIMFFLMIAYFTLTQKRIDSVKLYYIGNIEHCRIYTTKPFSSEFQKKRIDITNALIDQKASCIGNSFYIIDIEDLYLFSGRGHVFITRCTFEKNATDKIAGCKDVYVTN
ncbi:helix-turn-helix domain-containing protein [Klebsiella aerogenes]|uniref:winged helix-turn-helix domain-containing protein n=1 Tax=Klebsiella aerogenes TaxID=548 RepID=UPI0028E04752|nr:helix-turn-helix domain-containing protein [Klebsiella aerogenes]MDT8885997.1 helix-turn-helix domain-containing protein [Klebsiella aerogenes]